MTEITQDSSRIVYIKEIMADNLPKDIAETLPFDHKKPLYAICSAEGVPLSIVDSRANAFEGARQYNLEPYSVH